MDLQKTNKEVFLIQEQLKMLQKWACNWADSERLTYTTNYKNSAEGVKFLDCAPISPTVLKIRVQHWDYNITDLGDCNGQIVEYFIDTVTGKLLKDYESDGEE